MLHPTNVQIDDFGLWALEIDYGVKLKNGNPVPLVGHDDEGQATCFISAGFELAQLLRTVRSSRALKYQPIFIFFDIKPWDDQFSGDFKLSLGIEAARAVFGAGFIQLRELVDQDNGCYPTVPEWVGKAVLFFPNDTLRSSHADHCVSREGIETAIQTGTLFEEGALLPQESCGPAGCRVLRIDQYQADWTFDYGVPRIQSSLTDSNAALNGAVQDHVALVLPLGGVVNGR
jgi:hypothetical protein